MVMLVPIRARETLKCCYATSSISLYAVHYFVSAEEEGQSPHLKSEWDTSGRRGEKNSSMPCESIVFPLVNNRVRNHLLPSSVSLEVNNFGLWFNVLKITRKGAADFQTVRSKERTPTQQCAMLELWESYEIRVKHHLLFHSANRAKAISISRQFCHIIKQFGYVLTFSFQLIQSHSGLSLSQWITTL